MNKSPQATTLLRRNAFYLSWTICIASAAIIAFMLGSGAIPGASQSSLDRWLAIGPVPLPLSIASISVAAVALNLFWTIKRRDGSEEGAIHTIAPLASVVVLTVAALILAAPLIA